VNARSCRFTAAALGSYVSAQPSCSGTGSGSLTYLAENAAGNETMKLEVTGPCGTGEQPLSFVVCGYGALVVANGPTTFCQGRLRDIERGDCRAERWSAVRQVPVLSLHGYSACRLPVALGVHAGARRTVTHLRRDAVREVPRRRRRSHWVPVKQ
jgi:hypothetical protein